jgi:hypothetical protein
MKHDPRRRIFVALRMLLWCALTAADPILGWAQTNFDTTVEVYTNAIGVLRFTTVYPPDSESCQLVGSGRLLSWREYELYPLPGQAETNRIMTLAGDDQKVLDELRWLASEQVRVEGRLIEHSSLNEKGEPYRDLYHLVVTNVTEHGARKSLVATNLNSQQAHVLAKKLATFHFGHIVEDSAFERSAPPELISGRWVWAWWHGSGRGDVVARVSFAQDGSLPQVDWECFTSEAYMAR